MTVASSRGRPRRGVAGTHVFAVEDTAVQVCWHHLDPGEVVLRAGPAQVELAWDGGPGAATLHGLEPGHRYQVEVEATSGAGHQAVRHDVTTLPALDGPELVRLATLSDLHIGSDEWDLFGRMREPHEPDRDVHTVRCARAALAELQAWGAQHLFLKGDLTNQGQPDEWDTVGELLRTVRIPVHAIPGNHDAKAFPGAITACAGAARSALDLDTAPRAIDLPGLRVILFDSTVPDRHQGRIRSHDLDEVVALAAERSTPCLVLLHHYLQRTPVAWFWPPGIPGGQARRFLDALAGTNPRTVVSSGHTHRHRRREHGPVVVTEIGSPRDYPGTFGGYVVHDGGIRQVVRRIESPEAIAWTERTRRGAFGAWGRWSPGRLADRCFVHRWPA